VWGDLTPVAWQGIHGTGVALPACRRPRCLRVAVERDQLRNLTALETITVGYLDLKEAGLV
jgi:hypothetical protein